MGLLNFFDSHTHLQDKRFKESISDIIDRAQAAGVTKMICCSTREKDWDSVVELAQKHSFIIPAFGIHPWFVSKVSEDWEKRLVDYLNEIPSSIGECGLDFVVQGCKREVQEYIFKRQLLLAKKLHLPVSIHCRKAWKRLFAILKKVGKLPGGGLIHSYSGSHELVPALEEMGFYICFSGTASNPYSVKVHKALKSVSKDRLLIETDSPDLLPYTVYEKGKKKHNEPAYLIAVAKSVSELLGISLESVASQTFGNAMRLFSC